MSNQYKVDEKVLKTIYKTYIVGKNNNRIKLNIYYKNRKVSDSLVHNNLCKSSTMKEQSGVVYQINCPVDTCNVSNPFYIGYATQTVFKRVTEHSYKGALKDHLRSHHNQATVRDKLLDSAKIIKRLSDQNRLSIYEALAITSNKPSLNVQQDEFRRQLRLFN